jgi:Putative prokaryotic signal transducing protein
MIELLRTNDLVLISYVRALLAAEHIEAVGLDEHASVMDGNIAAVRRRIMVDDRDIERARQLLTDADLGHALTR